MSHADRMTAQTAAQFLARQQQAERDQLAGCHCEHGHLDDSDRPGGACLDEVLSRFPALEEGPDVAERYPFLKPCPWSATTDAECSMLREREVAGTPQSIPWCDHHGEYIDADDGGRP